MYSNHLCKFIFLVVFILPAACFEVRSDTFEVVPGKSVGKVTLGMSRGEVQKLLGKPSRIEDGFMNYISEKTNNMFFLGGAENVQIIYFTSPDFTVEGGLNTRNAMNIASENGYRKWAKRDVEFVGWEHPGGGLFFIVEGPPDQSTVFGVVYGKEVSVNQAIGDGGLYEVKSTPSESTVITEPSKSDWVGVYRYRDKVPDLPPWDYELTISCVEEGTCGKLTIDGPQTEADYLCSVEEEESSLTIRLLKPTPESGWQGLHEPGDILFILQRKSDGGLITIWKELVTETPPGTYFTKYEGGPSSTSEEPFTTNSPPNTDTKPIEGMSAFNDLSWEGKYVLSEQVPGRPPWDYVLDVLCANGDECAELKVDGPQTGKRIVCTTETLDNALLVRFLKDGPDNQFTSQYKKGDVLFTLTRNDKGTIATTWKELKPFTDDKDGSLNFLRIEGYTPQKRIEEVADQVIAELIQESDQGHEMNPPEVAATPQTSEIPYVDEAPGQSSPVAPEEPAPQKTQDIGVFLIILLLVLLAVVFIFWLSKIIANIIIVGGCIASAIAVYMNRFMFDDILQTLGAAVAGGLATGFLLLPLLPYSSFAVLLKSQKAQPAPPKDNAQAE